MKNQAAEKTSQKTIRKSANKHLRVIRPKARKVEQWALLFNKIPLAAAILDRKDLTVQYANLRMQEHIGDSWKSDAIVGRYLEEVFPQYEVSGLKEKCEQVAKTGQPCPDFQLKVPGNEKRNFTTYWQIKLEPLHSEGEDFEEILLTVADITNLTHVAHQVSSLLQISDGLAFESLDVDVVSRIIVSQARLLTGADMVMLTQLTDLNTMKILACEGNRTEAFLEMTTPLTHLAFHKERTRNILLCEDLILDGILSSATAEMVKMIVDESLRACVGVPLLNNNDEILGYLWAFQRYPTIFRSDAVDHLQAIARLATVDVRSAHLYTNLRIAYERQKDLDKMKDDFLATAAHELRTPLTVVIGYLDLLNDLSDDMSAEIRDFVITACKASEDLTSVLDRVLEVNRLDLEIQQFHIWNHDLKTIVQTTAQSLEAMASAHQHIISVCADEDLTVSVDSEGLRHVLRNLLLNAIRYSPTGTPVEIAISPVRSDTSKALIAIRDYGHGVPLNQQENIFGRFVRLEREMNSPMRGAGLGLYVSKRYIEAMGGRIWVRSSGVEGEGSTFFIELVRAES